MHTRNSYKNYILIVLAIVFGASFLLNPTPSHAFLEKFFGKKSIPQKVEEVKYQIHDDASFETNKKTFHMRPYNNPVLEFDISIPKNWAIEDLTNNSSIIKDSDLIQDVAMFKSEMIRHIQSLCFCLRQNDRKRNLRQRLASQLYLD